MAPTQILLQALEYHNNTTCTLPATPSSSRFTFEINGRQICGILLLWAFTLICTVAIVDNLSQEIYRERLRKKRFDGPIPTRAWFLQNKCHFADSCNSSSELLLEVDANTFNSRVTTMGLRVERELFADYCDHYVQGRTNWLGQEEGETILQAMYLEVPGEQESGIITIAG